MQDGTLNLILRNRFQYEIEGFAPDLKDEFHERVAQLKTDKNRLQGMLNNLVGKFARPQLAGAFRSRKCFPLSDYFSGIRDKTVLNTIDVRNRAIFQRGGEWGARIRTLRRGNLRQAKTAGDEEDGEKKASAR